MSDTKNKAIALVKRLQDAGREAILIGGCIRDQLLNLEPKDWDITTNALPEEMEDIFSDLRIIETGKAFGVLTVVVDGDQFQIARYRADGAYSDSRHPDQVRYVSTLKEDCARRDFTINQMAWDPITDTIIDHFHGQKDLDRRLIRFVGNPAMRIKEDPLRILRAVKFAVRLNFFLDDWYDDDENYSIRDYSYHLTDISRERISQEFQEILMHKRGLDLLYREDLLKYVIPGIEATWGLAGIQDSKYHSEGNVWVHTQRVVDILREHGADFKLLLAGLCHDLGKPATAKCFGDGRVSCHDHAIVGAHMAENICRYWLKLPTETTKYVQFLVASHMDAHNFHKLSDTQLKEKLAHPYIKDLVLLQHADATGRDSAEPKGSNLAYMTAKMAEFDALPKHMRPDAKSLIGGDDLIAYGLPPNEQFKHLLQTFRNEQLAGQFDETNAKAYMQKRLNGMALRVKEREVERDGDEDWHSCLRNEDIS